MSEFDGPTTQRDITPKQIERRRYRRAAVAMAVLEIRPERHIIRASSVSAGGLYCPDALPRPVGMSLLVQIDLPDGRQKTVAARIADAGTRKGCVIAFDAPVYELEGF